MERAFVRKGRKEEQNFFEDWGAREVDGYVRTSPRHKGAAIRIKQLHSLLSFAFFASFADKKALQEGMK